MHWGSNCSRSIFFSSFSPHQQSGFLLLFRIRDASITGPFQTGWEWACPLLMPPSYPFGSLCFTMFFFFFFWSTVCQVLFFEFLNFILFIFLYIFLLVIHFIHISVYMSVPISQFIPPPPHPPTTVFFLMVRKRLQPVFTNVKLRHIFAEPHLADQGEVWKSYSVSS